MDASELTGQAWVQIGGVALGAAELALAALALGAAALLVLAWVTARRSSILAARMARLEETEQRTERALREELGKHREEQVGSARHLREELGASFKTLGDSLGRVSEQTAGAQKDQLDSFAKQLHHLGRALDVRLEKLHETNERKLDEMRATVDEKLQGTLEKRLGEAFGQVVTQLEAVYRGLGEMRKLATGVGDLQKVLTNVKTRGTWGEVQLGQLLEQVLAPEQYDTNAAVRRGSAERVEYVVKLPGRADDDDTPVLLPLDAKFPLEDYQRLVEAEERGDTAAAEGARRALEQGVLTQARRVRDKYVNPPRTTDFAILYLPTEGLYAEVARRPALLEQLQSECRILAAGPTTLAALLNSLQMGFRTLAIQKRSSEVWKLLGALKKRFGALGDLLGKVQNKLDEASNQLEKATAKTRTIESSLRKVEELPEAEARELLPLGDDEPAASS